MNKWKLTEIKTLGSQDRLIAELVNVKADDKYINPETDAFSLIESNPLVYIHGNYYESGKQIGRFGWSVMKKKKK